MPSTPASSTRSTLRPQMSRSCAPTGVKGVVETAKTPRIGVSVMEEVLSVGGAGQRRVIQMVLVSVYCANASRPLSRPPKPDSLYPPKGVVMSPSE